MQSRVRVVRVLVDGPLCCLTSYSLIMDFLGHAAAAFVDPTDARRDCFEALSMSAERRLDAAELIGERPDMSGQLADLVRDRMHGLDRAIKIVPDIG